MSYRARENTNNYVWRNIDFGSNFRFSENLIFANARLCVRKRGTNKTILIKADDCWLMTWDCGLPFGTAKIADVIANVIASTSTQDSSIFVWIVSTRLIRRYPSFMLLIMSNAHYVEGYRVVVTIWLSDYCLSSIKKIILKSRAFWNIKSNNQYLN